MDRVVPITVLAGYLGAGKTTLLSRLANESTERTAFIVNAFDEVGLDPDFFATEAEVVQTNNGSLCCSVREDLIAAIRSQLARSTPPERIVVEASGLADPAAMIRAFHADATLRASTHLDAIVTIVDLRHIIGHWNTREACEQILFGDVILLNKADLVSEAELFAVRDRIRRMNSHVRMHVTQHCEVPIEEITGVHAFSLSRALTLDPHLLDDTAHEHDDEVSAVCIAREGVVDVQRFTRFLHAVGQECAADLFRVKGIVNAPDERKRLIVQGVHTWLETRPGEAWRPHEARTNRLVMIGRALDRPSLERAFAACVAPSVAAARPHI